VSAFAATSLALLAVLVTLPPAGFFSADSGPKYWQCLAFAEGEGRPRGFDYPARELDPQLRHIPPFTAPVGERLVSIYPVLFPVLAAIPQRALGDSALGLVPWLAALLAAWVTGRMASALRGETVTWPAAVAALAATPLAFYALTFWEHSLASAMTVAGLLLVVEVEGTRPGDGWRWVLLGLLVGLGAWVRTEVVFLAPVLLLAVVWIGRPAARRAAIVMAGLAAGLGAGAVVQAAALGRWLPLHVSYHVDWSSPAQSLFASRLPSLLHFVAPHWSCGLAATVWLAALAVVVTRGGSKSRAGMVLGMAAVVASIAAATVVPAARWLAGARPTEAFPVSAPAATWVVLSALPLLLWGQPREVLRDRRRWLLAAVAGWSVASMFVARPVRSLEWGSRLFLPAVLMLLALMASLPVAEGARRRLRRAAVVTAVGTAVVVQVMGLVLLRHGASSHQRITTELLAFTGVGEPVVSDSYMVPLLSGRGWWQRRFLYVTRRPGLEELAASFASHGVSRWTYATLERAPSGLLGSGQELVGRNGTRWAPVLAVERVAGSELLRLQRFERRQPVRGRASAGGS
jgi:hypothetical protein